MAYLFATTMIVLLLMPFFLGWLLALAAMLFAPLAPALLAADLGHWRSEDGIFVFGVFRNRRDMQHALTAFAADGIDRSDISTFERSSLTAPNSRAKLCRLPRARRFIVSLHLHHKEEVPWTKNVLFRNGARSVGTAPTADVDCGLREAIHLEKAPRAGNA